MSVYTWGFGIHGQLGNGQTATQHVPVSPTIPGKCIQISSGGHYTAVITDRGDLYTFGCGKYGRLGTGREDDLLKPVKIGVTDETGEDVKFRQVSCGLWHGAAVTTRNDIYIWGYCRNHGVQGHGNGTGTSVAPPSLLRGPFDGKVAGISCGNNFTLLWTQDGEAYSWGCGRHGVLGHGDTCDQLEPRIISTFKDMGVIVSYMDAGFAHCGAVSSDGNVFMFGRAVDGALGFHSKESVGIPTKVDSLCGIKELSCSVGEKHGHTLFVSETGKVFACGDGYKGKLGFGDQNSRSKPGILPDDSFNGDDILHLAAGGIHSAAVSRRGHVFTWGCGSDGRLGHPEGEGHRYLFRSDTPRIVATLASKSASASHICCSYYHTVALVDK